MNAVQKHPAAPAAAEIDLLPYLEALIRHRLWILAAALVAALLAALWAYSNPYMFQSTARVSIVDIEDPGGVSPDDRRASEVLTLVEHGFVMGTTHDNYNDVILARLASREFATRFIDNNNLYRHYYSGQWVEEDGVWVEGFEPDRGEVIAWFRDQVRVIDRDEETDIISVSMSWHDAALARDWANSYVRDFNEFMRARTMRDVSSKQDFLQAELRRAEVVEIQKSIYRLIEAQTAIAMLASAREEYVLEIIDPAALAIRSFSMSRKKKVFLGAIAGALLATFFSLAWVLLARMLQTLASYRLSQSSAITSEQTANSGSNL